jgi:hypothetical protein
MRRLEMPKDESGALFVPEDVFDLCVSMVKKPALRAKLAALRNEVANQSRNYDAQAASARLFEIAADQLFANVTADELVKVYTGRMVPKTATGRTIYDRILAQPRLGRCPLCGVGTVNSLDHFLPKTRFAILSVTPNNLIPSCSWCQTEKDDYFGTSSRDQLLHPYFDDVDDAIWLSAEVVEGVPS